MDSIVADDIVTGTHENPWTVVCRTCNQATSITGLFCIHHDATLLAFEPKKPITWALVLSPFLLCLLLSVWASYLPVYLVLEAGILAYLVVAFRHFQGASQLILLWGILAFALVTAGKHGTVLNLGSVAYFLLFLYFLLKRAKRYFRDGSHGLAVMISASLVTLTFYSVLLELARFVGWWLGKFGVADFWFSFLYIRYFYWIFILRGTIVSISLLVVLGETAHVTSSTHLRVSPVCGKFVSQLERWADYAFLFCEKFWSIFREVKTAVVDLSIHFTIEAVVPVFLVLVGAWSALWSSHNLNNYLHGVGSALVVGASLVLTALLMLAFAYFEAFGSSPHSRLGWPDFRSSFGWYWKGAISDVRVLLFHLVWLIPSTTAVLWFAHLISNRLNHGTLFPGIGVYSIASTLLFFTASIFGFRRNSHQRL